ncbi:DUF4238 domain-containing protein [Massilia sp. LjRoot122]|uniref:DUF4238 domain-containing protein n=1 Tax=Massilia sp. LjRoot122 TaxID=3342257 RepID=UPI003ECFA657
MTANISRNHHWVPQCYLKGFTKGRSKKSTLHVTDFETGRQFPTVPRNVAAGRDFNRVDIDGIPPDYVESGIAVFEGKLDKALERICREREIKDPEDRNLVLNLIALLAVRNPGMRENVRRSLEQVMKRVMDLTLATKERYESSFAQAARVGALQSEDILPYERMRDFVDRDEYAISVSTTHHVGQELKLVDSVLPLLGQRRWLLARALPGTGGFITSDHPVILQWADRPMTDGLGGPGFALRGTEVLFTISHDLAMIGTFEGPDEVVDADEAQVALMNGVILGHWQRQIYARDDRFRYRMRDGEIRRGADVLRHLGTWQR